MTVIERIVEFAREDLPASEAAAKLGLTYAAFATLIRQECLHKTYSAIRKAEQQRAFSRVFASTESEPPLPPIPSKIKGKTK